jgi:hypothetical protein
VGDAPDEAADTRPEHHRDDAVGGTPPGDPVAAGVDVDAPTEVDATVATQRRTAVSYAAIFLLVTGAVPVLTLVLPWWNEARLAGGLSPNFVVAAGGLYLFFLGLGIAAATLARSIEERMLGGPDDDGTGP